MNKKDLRIIFMGTPDFAVPSLEILVKHDYQVVAVITAPDKPKGRGQKVMTSPVKDFALAHKIPVLQPVNLKSAAFLEKLKAYQAELQVVVAFRMLPEVIWAMPSLGTFNLHASLLPQYRGAAPINWAIINGEKETGISTFFLQHEIDTGNIIFQEKEVIFDDDDAGSLYQRLMHKGAGLVLKTVKSIENKEYKTHEQRINEVLKKAPKIFKEDCEILWKQSSEKVRNFIRGLSPYPGAWTNINGTTYKIFRVALVEEQAEGVLPGTYKTDNKSYLHFKTNDGTLAILDLQKQGKKRMAIIDFLRGNNL